MTAIVAKFVRTALAYLLGASATLQMIVIQTNAVWKIGVVSVRQECVIQESNAARENVAKSSCANQGKTATPSVELMKIVLMASSV